MQRRTLLLGSALGSAFSIGLAGCSSSPQISDYAQEKPLFDLKTYFDGVVDGWGIFTDRSGKVVKRFIVTMIVFVKDVTLKNGRGRTSLVSSINANK